MSSASKREYLYSIRSRYQKASRAGKKRILDEFCSTCCYNRKYAIRILNQKTVHKSDWEKAKRGPKRKYNNPEIIKVLKYIWRVTNLPCSKRLKAIFPIWLPHYPYYVSTKTEKALYSISPATIDRIMKPWRAKFSKRGLSTTKPGAILKKHIPVKTKQWEETRPGFIEADTVAHCGNTVAGMFVYTINGVDIATGWTEQRAVWGKGERGVLNGINDIEDSLPFDILGFDCDNGSEFLNWHLVRHFTNRKQPVQFTRSRAYHKNDNAHVEGKNWTHIRQYLGYQRFENIELVELMNDLYKTQWNLYFNFFIPAVKLITKERIGSKIIKKYDKPKTPFERLMESEYISARGKKRLQNQYQKLNPFELQKQLAQKIKNILNVVNEPEIITMNKY